MEHKFYPVKEIGQIMGANVHLADPDSLIRTLCTDSRKITDTVHSLFFALQDRRNGHAYIQEAYTAGIRNFVVSEYQETEKAKYPGANFLVVSDTLLALQLLASHHRRQFNYPVLAITGSNGKTIVKEWLFQLLSPEYQIVRSPNSYNSQIGVPLSVWQMNGDHTLAIFETGISTSGEMAALAEVIHPSVGVLTHIGEAHQSGFASREEKIKEKLFLFKEAELFIYSPSFFDRANIETPGKRVFTWNLHNKADLEVHAELSPDPKYCMLNGSYAGKETSCIVPFTDAASIENLVCCWAVLIALGYRFEEAGRRLEKLLPVKMRLELKNGINNCSVIDDSYSLDSSSLSIALDFLKQQNQHQKRTLILSDLPETGKNPELVYEQVAALLQSKWVSRLIGVGKEISSFQDKFPMEKIFFNSTEELLLNIDSLKFANETILLKGARKFGFEKISKLLSQKVHETILEVNLNALEYNLNFYRSKLKPGVKLMAVVKAFSYGSGSFEIANILQFNKVDYLAVAFADEGVALRKAGITLPIMVMNADSFAFDILLEYRLEPEIFSLRILRDLAGMLRTRGLNNYPVHVKLDTGMHRLGFMPHEIDELIALLKNNPAIEVRSVFSHLVSSEDPSEDSFTQHQLDVFRQITAKMETELNRSDFLKHISNTSAISRTSDAQFDMVRLGIGMYGIDSVYKDNSPLRPVMVLKTSISQIKTLAPGDTVGYNRKGVLPKGGKIATVKIGYADGYSRKLGNGAGFMLINGKRVHTIGNVCMDMSMLDVTHIDAREGDEVIIFNEEIKIEDIANTLETIPYEVLTSISQRVKRIYYYE